MNVVDVSAASDIRTAIIFSCIAFSIVFIVLGGLTLVIYAMRVLTGNNGSNGTGGSASKENAAAKAGPAQPQSQAAAAVSSAAVNVKSQHIAAITAAILAVTGGARILSVTPSGAAAASAQTAGGRWRAAGIVEANSRRVAPTWKR